MTTIIRQTIIAISFCTLLSCNSRKPQENKTDSNDTSAAPYSFNKNEEIYVVSKINEDSIDGSGNTWNWVEMKNSKNEIFKSCIPQSDPMEIGDRVLVGHDDSGKPYIVAINKKNEGEPDIEH
jgi:hypothetical protein